MYMYRYLVKIEVGHNIGTTYLIPNELKNVMRTSTSKPFFVRECIPYPLRSSNIPNMRQFRIPFPTNAKKIRIQICMTSTTI